MNQSMVTDEDKIYHSMVNNNGDVMNNTNELSILSGGNKSVNLGQHHQVSYNKMLNNSVIVEGQKAATGKLNKNKLKANDILGPAKIGNFVNEVKSKKQIAPTINQNQINFMNDF